MRSPRAELVSVAALGAGVMSVLVAALTVVALSTLGTFSSVEGALPHTGADSAVVVPGATSQPLGAARARPGRRTTAPALPAIATPAGAATVAARPSGLPTSDIGTAGTIGGSTSGATTAPTGSTSAPDARTATPARSRAAAAPSSSAAASSSRAKTRASRSPSPAASRAPSSAPGRSGEPGNPHPKKT